MNKYSKYIMVAMMSITTIFSFSATANAASCNHSYYTVSRKDPTCTKTGNNTLKCRKCKKTKVETIAKFGHSYNVASEVKPTCTKSGYVKKRCVRCRKEIKSTLGSLGHNYVDGRKIAPTCTEGGFTERVCTRCHNVVIKSRVKARGHNWVTCDGIKQCKRCGVIRK